MTELTLARQRNLLNLVPILLATYLLYVVGTDFERQFITISAVGPVRGTALDLGTIVRESLFVLFGLTCWFAASSEVRWSRVAVWCAPLGLSLIMVNWPSIYWLTSQTNGAGFVISLWWTTIVCVAVLFWQASRLAGGLMVPHVVYATYLSLAVWWSWGRG